MLRIVVMFLRLPLNYVQSLGPNMPADTNTLYRVSKEERSKFWEVTVLDILSKKVNICMYPIQNGFRGRAISLYSSKIVDKEILRNASNTGIYCSSDKVGTVYIA
jgi:hypothetical protein